MTIVDPNKRTSDDLSTSYSSARELLKSTRIEPLILLQVFAVMVRYVSVMQLFQDKMCLHKYRGSREFCSLLSEKESTMKDSILADSSVFMTYKEFGALIPGTLSALFFGSFCDKYRFGCRYSILSTLFCQLLETIFLVLNAFYFDLDPVYLVLSFIIPSIFGNEFAFYTATYAYTASTVKSADRAIRYLLIMLCHPISYPIATVVGGLILKQEPLLAQKQLQNYMGTFIASGLATLVAIVYTFLFINESWKDDDDPQINGNNGKVNFRHNVSSIEIDPMEYDVNENSRIIVKKSNKKQSSWNIIKSIVSLDHLKEVFMCSIKPRPGTLRLRMWLVVLAINFHLLTYFGTGAVQYSIVQKLYKWDSFSYSNFTSLVGVFRLFAISFLIPLIRLFKLNDMQTTIVGCVSHAVGLICIGSITNPIGFVLDAVIASVGGVAGSGNRAYLSKVLPKDDVAKMFAVTLVIEGIEKCFGSYLFAMILKLTISYYVTFVYHFMAVILIVTLVIQIYTDLTTPYPL